MQFPDFRCKDIIAAIIAIYQICIPLVIALVIVGAAGAVVFHFLFR